MKELSKEVELNLPTQYYEIDEDDIIEFYELQTPLDQERILSMLANNEVDVPVKKYLDDVIYDEFLKELKSKYTLEELKAKLL